MSEITLMLQFNTSSISIILEDEGYDIEELSEIAKKLAFEILEKAKKVRL